MLICVNLYVMKKINCTFLMHQIFQMMPSYRRFKIETIFKTFDWVKARHFYTVLLLFFDG